MNKYRIVKGKECGTYTVQRLTPIGPFNVWQDDNRKSLYKSSDSCLTSMIQAENHVSELRIIDKIAAEYNARQKAWNAGEVMRTYD